jgi:16S rRNA C1402 (ribose-2'-O) methylase RsmI
LTASKTRATVGDLARVIAARETGTSAATLSERPSSRFTSPYHFHLPKFAAADVVEYDTEREMVGFVSDAGVLGRLLSDVAFGQH